jgi:serine phosphatase RsbU (regulator of sigma subunit)
MATRPIPRKSVRLRIEYGTALITNLAGGEISCDLADIGLNGCKCRVVTVGIPEDVIGAWKLILAPERVLGLRFGAPAEISSLNVPSAEIRWVSDREPGAILFGVKFGGLSPEQLVVLSSSLMTMASRKLRGTGTTPLPFVAPAPAPAPTAPVAPAAVEPEPAPEPAVPEPVAEEVEAEESVASEPEAAEPVAAESTAEEPVALEAEDAADAEEPVEEAEEAPSEAEPAAEEADAVVAADAVIAATSAPMEDRIAPKAKSSAAGLRAEGAPPAKGSGIMPRVQTKSTLSSPVSRRKSSTTMPAVSGFSTGRKRLPGGRRLPPSRVPEPPPVPEPLPVKKPNDWSEIDKQAARPTVNRNKEVREVRERPLTEIEVERLKLEAEKAANALSEIRKNLEAARRAQTRMLPEKPPSVKGYDMAALYESCVELSGDLYHFIDAGPGRTGLLIGDVSGHGVEAAMVMSATLKSFSVRGKNAPSPSVVLSAVNEDLHNDLRRGMFVTAFYAILDHASGKLTYARAGHNPALLISPRVGLRPLEGNGIALGIADSKRFDTIIEQNTVEIQNDALLVMYTDGIVEAMNAQKEEFGEGRLCELLWQNSSQPCDSIIQAIQSAVRAHTAGLPIADDQTLVILKKS